MNSNQARQISLVSLLSRLGHEPTEIKKSGGERWYFSPFRAETEPSFNVKVSENVWFDFGEGRGGGPLDFVMHLRRERMKPALDFLTSLSENPADFHFEPVRAEKLPDGPGESPKLHLEEIRQLSSQALLDWLDGRKIPADLARAWLHEARFANRGRLFYALAWPNLAGGHEVRNAFFKSSFGGKDMSFIPGRGGEGLAIFEGYLDFLSWLAHTSQAAPETDVLVLNSVSFGQKAVDFIRKNDYRKLPGFLDNDPAGDRLTAFFAAEFGPEIFDDRRSLFTPFKDYNEFLSFIR